MKEMIRIVLVCAGGYSSRLLVRRIMEEANDRKINITCQSIGENTVTEHMGEFDVLLLAPQVSNMLNSFEKLLDGSVPVDVIDIRDYGTMNGSHVLDQALMLCKK